MAVSNTVLKLALGVTLAFVLLACIVQNADAQKPQHKRIAREKAIFGARQKSKTGMITVNSDKYHQWLLLRRDFHAFIMHTMDDPKCPTCQQLKPEFELVADAFKRRQKEFAAGDMVYFFYADYKQNERVFAPNPSLKHVPIVAYLPPGPRRKTQPNNAAEARTKWMDPFKEDHIMPQATIMGGADHIADWAAELMKWKEYPPIVRPEVYVNPWPARFRFLLLLVGGISTIVILTKVVGGPKVGFMISLVVIFWTYSGGYWNTHRHPEFQGPNGEYYVGYNGSQYVIEGMLIGALSIVSGFSLIAMNTVVPKIKGGTQKLLVASAVIVLGVATFRALVQIYIRKNGGYLVMGRA